MAAPKFCECGKRIAVIGKRPKGRWAARRRSPKHDLCEGCWARILDRKVTR